MRMPDYEGGGLVNLVAELELRLTGDSVSPGLRADLAGAVPEASSYVLVLFDGLGDLQLSAHDAGAALMSHRVGGLDTSFSTQTSVVTATIATGLPPSQHGLISYVLKHTDGEKPVNTLWWFDIDGSTPDIDLELFLPAPNLAERLGRGGSEAVVIEPAAYLGSPLDRVLYRGVRTIGVEEVSDMASVAIEEVSAPGRVVVVYLPHVDGAGHVEGTRSQAYTDALELVTRVWTEVGTRLPPGVAMVGTADHGMVDTALHFEIDPPSGLMLSGDSRVVYAHGDAGAAIGLVSGLPASWVGPEEMDGLWGPGPFHPQFEQRRPDGLIVADPGVGLLYPGNSVPLAGLHGGLTEEEVRVPILVWPG